MAEKIFKNQVNYGWGLSLNMTGKYPAVAKRIFDTLADAQAFADDFNDSAIEGLVLSVVADDDSTKNGVYFVQSIKTGAEAAAAVLVKLGSASAAASGASNALTEAKAYTDAEVKKLADGAVKTNTDKIATLNGNAQTEGSVAKAVADAKSELLGNVDETDAKTIAALNDKIGTVDDGKTVMGTIAEEVENRQTAISNLKGTLVEGDATTLEAINDELDAIDAKIGVVPTGKTVVGMIAAAESAAKAAATKLVQDNEGHVTVSGVQDQTTSAWTYTISESDIASASGLTDETNRAVSAEAILQAQIGTGFTSGNTVAAAIADAKDYASGYTDTKIASLNANVTSAEGTKVRVQVVETAGKITSVNITDVDIASAQALADEVTAREDADTNLQSQIGKAATEEGGPTGLHKEIADAKSALLGNVAETDAKTLAALNDRIDDVVTAAKTYSIAKATKEEAESLGTNVKEAYKLIDEDKQKVGDYIPVYKDSSLQGVALVEQELKFTYLLADGSTSTVGVDVSKFLAESEFANGLQVIDHIVSVKRDATSEGFLTVGADGIKLSGVQSAIDTAKKEVTDRLNIIEGEANVDGSIKKALKDAKDYTDAEIDKLDAEVTSTDGSHVTVKVTEVDGVITAVNVTESDIASAQALADEVSARTAADNTINGKLNVIQGTGEGSISKALADAKDYASGYTDAKITDEKTARENADNAITNKIGTVAEGKTVVQMIEDAQSAAKAAATKLNKVSDASHLTLTSVTGTSGEITYTIGESDIASKTALDNEVTTRTADDNAIKGRLDVLEGVTVTGKDAIVVSKSDAKKNKEVSLKLGTQPAEGKAGIVLSQDTNGLVAKLYWGTF